MIDERYPRTQRVLDALETRAKLGAAEQACLDIGRMLSEQIRVFTGHEMISYAYATKDDAEASKEA